jgi:hypothetical protein
VVGSRFGRYRIEEELGRGDFGVTYRAVVEGSQRTAALKLAHEHLSADDLFMALLEREAETLARLGHPGIAAFGGFVSDGGRVAAVRECVQGEDLLRVTARGRVPVEHLPGVLRLALDALAHAHEQQTLHGDLTPANIFWCFDGSLRITDFGLARAVHVAASTRSGQPSGHPDTMAPELALGQMSARSDLYSLGIIAYECIVGHPACQPGDAAAKLSWHRYVGMPDPRLECPECPDWLARVLLQLAAIDPATRPKDARAALGLLRPVAAPTMHPEPQGGSATATVPSGLEPPPPPERTPPAPPRLDPPVLDDTIPTSAPQGFGGAGFGALGSFGATEPGATGAAPPRAPSDVTAPVVPTILAQQASAPPRTELPPVTAVQRAGPRKPPGEEDDPVKERLKLAAFWSVALGVLLVSVVAFVGYRAMEARRLAAARATGPAIDPELILGGGYDRFGEPIEEEQPRGGAARGIAKPSAEGGERGGADGTRAGQAVVGADERYLIGGGDQPSSEYTSLSLSSNPIGARVWIDNKEVGHTPLEDFGIREGRHVVRLELEGFAWASRDLEVQRGAPLNLGSITLEREVVAAGAVLLWSVELEGANVFVDGTHAGRMPVVVQLTPGRHSFFVQPSEGEPVELEREVFPGTDDEPGRLQLEPR